jgi:protein-tyrosine kinase
MSRIEKALERALELRESQRSEPAASKAPDGQAASAVALETALPEYKPVDKAIDKRKVDKHVVCITDPYSHAAEQYRRLRARLLIATKNDFLNTIMVTSAGVGEGKTITATNLAVTLASAYDHTVLLVEADIRKPAVCRYLGITPKCGLSDCLSGKAELKDAIVKTGIGKLSVLPAGKSPDNPSEVLSSEKMKRLVGELKARYKDRYVIFDTSPVLDTAETLSLGGFVDGVIIVAQAGQTSEKLLGQAVSLMKGYNILGVVLNNMPQSLAKAASRYYGHYGYYTSHETGGPAGSGEKHEN